MTYFEGASILFLIVNGVLVPITLYYVARGQQTRTASFAALDGRLDHLDHCLDTLKVQVAGTAIPRPEFENRLVNLRKETLDEFAKQNAARHDQATRVQVLVDSVEERLTRRLERVEGMLRPGGAGL